MNALADDPLRTFASRHGYDTADSAMSDLCGQLRLVAGQEEPPIGVERRMLDVLRASKVSTSSLPVEGQLGISGGTYQVFVSDAAYWRRRRWTVAHEIGHMLVLDTLADSDAALRALRTPEVMPAVEALCHFAASELLLPTDHFDADLASMSFDRRSLTWLYDRYLVSWGALFVRLARSLPGSSLTLWNTQVRPDDHPGKFRVTRAYGRSEIWLPRGLSDRYLSKPILHDAVCSSQGAAADLEVRLGHKNSVRCHALSARLPLGGEATVALLLMPLELVDDWRRLQAPLQLELPLL